MISHEEDAIAFIGCVLFLTYLNVAVSYVDFLEGVLTAVSGAVGDAVSQEFTVNSIRMGGTPTDVYRTRRLVVGRRYCRFS